MAHVVVVLCALARALAVVWLCSACISTGSARSRGPEPGLSVEGRTLEASVLGDGPRTLLVIAGIHGTEPAGGPLVRRFERELQAAPERLSGIKLVLVPELNPDGLASGKRTNARGVDLNRNWPARNFTSTERHGGDPLTEPETRFLANLLEHHRPVLVLSFHQPLACVDYDGPAKQIAERIARACKLPVKKLGARPGSLGAYVGEDLGVPILTLELPAQAHRSSEDELWRRYGPLLWQALDEAFALDPRPAI